MVLIPLQASIHTRDKIVAALKSYLLVLTRNEILFTNLMS
jgi:hypothetical protein